MLRFLLKTDLLIVLNLPNTLEQYLISVVVHSLAHDIEEHVRLGLRDAVRSDAIHSLVIKKIPKYERTRSMLASINDGRLLECTYQISCTSLAQAV